MDYNTLSPKADMKELISKAEILIEKGLLEHHPKRASVIRLTPRGFALSDQIIAEFVG